MNIFKNGRMSEVDYTVTIYLIVAPQNTLLEEVTMGRRCLF